MANTRGLKQEAVLAKKDGTCEARGVIMALLPKTAVITMNA